MVNEHEIICDYASIVRILNDILGKPRSHNEYSGQVSYDCPVCSYEIKGLDHPDGKGNLEINYKLEVFKCWACGESHGTKGGLRYFIKKHGTKKHLKKYDLLRPENSDITKKKYNPVRLPKEFTLFYTASQGLRMTHYYKRAMSYLRSRNITDELIKKYNMGFCYTGEYADRIIIPSYDEEFNLNYFIARSYDTRTKLKYKNPEAEKEAIIWNEHLIDWDDTIYLVEGPFDSIFVPNSIPMLGKVISEKLFSQIYEKAKKIVIILDGDAWIDAENLYHKLNGGRLFGKIWIVKLPVDKDIADLQGNLDNFEIKQLD